MRIAGINIPALKKVYVGLTSIYGIGFTTAKKVCDACGVNPEVKVKDLSPEESSRIIEYVNGIETEGELRSRVKRNIEMLKNIKCYKGLRHIRNLPVNGQNTQTNARTRKGKKRISIANKKKA